MTATESLRNPVPAPMTPGIMKPVNFLRRTSLMLGTMLVPFVCVESAEKPRNPEWPEEVREIRYRSSGDDSLQPALFFAPEVSEPRPLLVGLHTWSGNYRQKSSVPYAEWCIEEGWVFIHPNFRGPNLRPEACGSELVVADILSAVDYAKSKAAIDESRIYLAGASGGGYASLLMAGRAPEIWAGVSAWVPINDLQTWYSQSLERNLKYADHIMQAAGGIPFPGTPAEKQCRRRSAATWLPRARSVRLDINAGIHDGHTGSVPVSHSLNAFNLVADTHDRISPEEIDFIVKQRKVPESLTDQVEKDELYGGRPVLFRRYSRHARVTLFEGGHEIIPEAALNWLKRQRKTASH